jgi:O-acetylhomoserine (thiol)-lyase
MGNSRIDTRGVQSGYDPKNGEPRVPSIVQSTTFRYDSCDEMGRMFDLEGDGFFYTRIANPTAGHVEAKIADLEGGSAAMLTASGQAAVLLAVAQSVQAEEPHHLDQRFVRRHVTQFKRTIPSRGIEVTFLEPRCTRTRRWKPRSAKIRNGSTERCCPIHAGRAGHRRLADAPSARVPLVVDNTFRPRSSAAPFEHVRTSCCYPPQIPLDGHARAWRLIAKNADPSPAWCFSLKTGNSGTVEPDE